MAKKKVKSPWQRHQKTEYAYSLAFKKWNEAVKLGDRARIDEAAREHSAFCRRETGDMPYVPYRLDPQTASDTVEP